MRMIRPCSTCAAPVTVKMSRCPHGNATNLRGVLHRTVTAVATLAGGLAMSTTLSACYGAPCAQDDDPYCPDKDYVPTCSMVSAQPQTDDADGDGYCRLQDCNENDKAVNASARDIPNDGIDQNCDGKDAR
jgi:hypothetical protein